MSTQQEEYALAFRMATEMVEKLELHSDREHWLDSSMEYLLEGLEQEVEELKDALRRGLPGPSVWVEAADVANYAAMLADLRLRGTKGDPK